MNYLQALSKDLNKEAQEEEQEERCLKAGWVQLGLVTGPEEEESLNDRMNAAVDEMVERHAVYRRVYIRLYGEDAYTHFYGPAKIAGATETEE